MTKKKVPVECSVCGTSAKGWSSRKRRDELRKFWWGKVKTAPYRERKAGERMDEVESDEFNLLAFPGFDSK